MDWTFSFCSLHNIIAYYCIFDLASVWQCSRKVTLSCCNNVVWPWIVGERRDQKWVIENTPSILKVDISDVIILWTGQDSFSSQKWNALWNYVSLIMFILSDCLYKWWKSSCLQLYKKLRKHRLVSLIGESESNCETREDCRRVWISVIVFGLALDFQ